MSDKIFGTPPEPLFRKGAKDTGDSAYLDCWLKFLLQKNLLDLDRHDSTPSDFQSGRMAEEIFLLCDRLQVSPEARYLTLELFHRFMIQHIKGLYQHIQRSTSETKRSVWSSLIQRISKQVILRVVSCIQAASKMTSHYKVVTLSRASDVLKSYGYTYSRESLLMSEVRVLKTVGYNINILTALDIIEALLQLIGQALPDCNIKVVYSICQQLLDFCYIQRSLIYTKLLSVLSDQENPSQEEKSEFRLVEGDKTLLSSGIIATSVWIYDQASFNHVVYLLERYTQVPQEDTTDFSNTLVQVVLS